MEAQTCKRGRGEGGVCVEGFGRGGGLGKEKKNKRGGGQAGKQDSDIHALRRGDTDKVSSPPLGQAVITVGPRFQVATLSGTGIIGSRLGATTQPRCGPAMPLSDSEAWLWDTEHTHTESHTQAHWSALATSLATICPALPCSGLGTASNGHALTRLS